MRRRISALLLGVPLVAGIVASPLPPAVAWVWAAQPGAASPQLAAGGPTLRQMIGQKLMVAMRGTRPGPGLLDRIRRGEVGGVILFSANIRSPAQLARLTRTLRRAARTGGRPPLLIATDQEGGLVKRVGWAPPSLSPPRMGALGSPAAARSQGKGTGRMLSCAGINHDLAPVADVPRSTASFMFQQGRTWSFDASVTTMLSNAFAGGLLANGVLPTLKHFPGIGLAARNTDTNVVTISASRRALAPGLRAYRRGIADRLPLIMPRTRRIPPTTLVAQPLAGHGPSAWACCAGISASAASRSQIPSVEPRQRGASQPACSPSGQHEPART
jgi:hypothetical protein